MRSVYHCEREAWENEKGKTGFMVNQKISSSFNEKDSFIGMLVRKHLKKK